MAPPPKSKQLTVEVPEEAAEWFPPFLAQLNDFVLSVTSALQASLTRAQNFTSQRYLTEIETTGSVDASFPLTFNCTLPQAPEEVRLTQARILTPGGSFAGSGSVTAAHWELVEGNQIKVYKISNLNPNTKYAFAFTIT